MVQLNHFTVPTSQYETPKWQAYGVLDGEDLKTRDDKVQNGGRGGIRTLGGR